MAYRLDASGSPPDEIRVAARDQLEVAMAGLRAAADRRDPGEEIHTARKSLRRFRATLRLIRPHLGGHDYRHAARPARALGRRLSSPRDADVMARTLRGLIDDVSSRSEPAEAVAHALEERRRSEWEALSADAWLSRGAPASLTAIEEQVDGWALDGLDWRSLLDGVARSYRRARKASTAAQRAGSSEALHEARKRAKDLRYELDLLARGLGTDDGRPGDRRADAHRVHRHAPRPRRPAVDPGGGRRGSAGIGRAGGRAGRPDRRTSTNA